MTAHIRLVSNSGEFRIESKGSGWCEVSLRIEGDTRVLGADSPGHVLEGFRRALADDLAEGSGAIGGTPVTWAFSPAEAHSSVYAADVAGARLLFVQDRDARLIGVLRVDAAVRADWHRCIDSAALTS